MLVLLTSLLMKNLEIYEELKEDFKRKNENKSILKYKILWLALMLAFFVPVITLFFMKSYEYIDSFDNISEPVQIPTSGWTIIEVDWEIVDVIFLAEYDLMWRVLATAQYGWNIFERLLGSYYLEDNIIRYKDVWIWWWFLTLDEYVKKFNWKSMSRFLLPEPKSYEDWLYVTDRYSWEDINSHMSHNHLIPANNRVKKLIHWIKKWQYVRIKWYLVWLHWKNGYNLVSSLTREDQWNWACETIYVTDVIWLKEK